MLNDVVEELARKIEFDEMYDAFLSMEICGNCPTLKECSKCRYFKNSYSMNGGDKHGTARKDI